MAFVTTGCVTANEVFAIGSYAVGQRILGPAPLPDRYTAGNILVQISEITDLTTVINVLSEVSLDGGVNWNTQGGFGLDLNIAGYTRPGSILLDASGVPVRVTGTSLFLLQPLNTTRQMRLTCSFDNATHQAQTLGLTVTMW